MAGLSLVFLWNFFMVHGIQSIVFAVKLQIITSLNYDLKLSNDLMATGGAFDLAAENVNRRYAGHLSISLHHLYNASHRSCDDVASQAAQMISQYYYREAQNDTCYALVTSRKKTTVSSNHRPSQFIFQFDLMVHGAIGPAIFHLQRAMMSQESQA